MEEILWIKPGSKAGKLPSEPLYKKKCQQGTIQGEIKMKSMRVTPAVEYATLEMCFDVIILVKCDDTRLALHICATNQTCDTHDMCKLNDPR